MTVVCPAKKALQSQLPQVLPVSEKVSFQIPPSAAKHSTCLVDTRKLSQTTFWGAEGMRGIKFTH